MKTLIPAIAALGVTLGLAGAEARAACPEAEVIHGWYQRYLGRPADAVGLHSWSHRLHCGAPLEEVQAGILASEEYFCRHGHSAPGFVAGLYANVLGRAAADHEIHHWVCQLAQCGCRKRLALDFLCAARVELAQRAGPVVVPAYAPIRTVPPPVVAGGISYHGPLPRSRGKQLGVELSFVKRRW
jgi:hypothetical protein